MYLINLSDRIAKVMMVFAALWAFGLSFLIVADALSRSFLNFPLNGTKDIVENSIVIIIFLQAGYAIRSRSMLQSDILLSRLPLKIKKIMLLIGYLLGMFFFYVMISGSWDIAIQAFNAMLAIANALDTMFLKTNPPVHTISKALPACVLSAIACDCLRAAELDQPR